MRSSRLFVIAGLLVAAGLALFLSPLASGAPDGLNRVAADQGFAQNAEEHTLDASPVAGYALRGVDDPWWSKGLSGLIGVLVTFGVGLCLFGLIRARRSRVEPPPNSEPGD